jgi:hypothetical protein
MARRTMRAGFGCRAPARRQPVSAGRREIGGPRTIDVTESGAASALQLMAAGREPRASWRRPLLRTTHVRRGGCASQSANRRLSSTSSTARTINGPTTTSAHRT